MKAILTMVLMLLIAIAAVAQEVTDTIETQQLQEIVIQAPKVIRKADMDVYYPSRSAVDNSKNGVQLLNNLMIPSLTVTEALGTIQAAGQSVQVRINGRASTIDQVKALLPETIKRVEWIDNPGLRYNGANYVLNFVVSNPTAGGSLMTNAMPALNQAWGNYFADLKLNSGRSQFEVWGRFKLTDKIKTHRDYKETFTYPDGTSLTRKEISDGGAMDNTVGNFTASYSYIKPDTTVLMVDLSYYRKFTDRFTYNGLLSLSNGMDDILLSDIHGDKGSKPHLSVYFEQHFADRQMLVVDFNSSFYFGRSYSDYVEQLPDATEYLTDIHTMIKDRNQAYGIEADYIKSWKNSRFTAGISYTANRNRSVYENLGGEIFHQRQDKVYFFAEYFQRIKKFTLTAGMGAQYTDFMFKESNQGSKSWNMRPQATVTYGINQNHQFKLSFETWQSTPSLAETNVAPQQLDSFQWRMGNPSLKTSNSYMLTLRYNFNVPRVAGSFGIRAFTSPNAITPVLYWDNDRLITTYENSQGLRNLSFFIAPQIEILPGWLMLSGYLQYRMERMRGTGYKLHNHNWSGNANLRLMHWGFVLSAQYMRAQHDLWGEKISWGENISVIDISYNWKDWQFGAGMIMPFGKYDQGSKMLSKWNTNEQHMRLDMRMPYISISYNLQWGHQKRSARKRIKAAADVDTSTAGGR
ncbi:outer membrane beta-barrel protein [uncultured Duncaniella sp.]|uniref:outer membrane beta-barrel protein n=1 Tax=uncultured Duncaniella sp. TaxID=2768039 RepID=UPI0026064381|nr:outer membrane beta-barrel protein [uncultured Duncaniella sp.]